VQSEHFQSSESSTSPIWNLSERGIQDDGLEARQALFRREYTGCGRRPVDQCAFLPVRQMMFFPMDSKNCPSTDCMRTSSAHRDHGQRLCHIDNVSTGQEFICWAVAEGSERHREANGSSERWFPDIGHYVPPDSAIANGCLRDEVVSRSRWRRKPCQLEPATKV
jgi:hypothetical protein